MVVTTGWFNDSNLPGLSEGCQLAPGLALEDSCSGRDLTIQSADVRSDIEKRPSQELLFSKEVWPAYPLKFSIVKFSFLIYPYVAVKSKIQTSQETATNSLAESQGAKWSPAKHTQPASSRKLTQSHPQMSPLNWLDLIIPTTNTMGTTRRLQYHQSNPRLSQTAGGAKTKQLKAFVWWYMMCIYIYIDKLLFQYIIQSHTNVII